MYVHVHKYTPLSLFIELFILLDVVLSFLHSLSEKVWLGRFFIVLYASIFLIATFHHTDYVLIYIHMISRFMSSTHCCNVVICHKSDPHYTRFETSLSLLQNVNKLGHELVHESLNSALLCLVCISIIFEGYFEIINVSFDLIIFVYLP